MNPWRLTRSVVAKVCGFTDQTPLSFWSFHLWASVSSFFYWVAVVNRKWTQATGMAAGVMFLISVAVASSRIIYPVAASAPRWRRALRPVIWIWSSWSLLGLLALWLPVRTMKLLLLPNLVVSALADAIVRGVGFAAPVRWIRELVAGPDPTVRRHHFLVGDMDSVIPAFLVTVVAGFIVLTVLMGIALVVLAYAPQHRPAVNSGDAQNRPTTT
jgi:hypothetical protein